MKLKYLAIPVLAVAIGAGIYVYQARSHKGVTPDAAQQGIDSKPDTQRIMANLKEVLVAYRKIIVLFADEAKATDQERDRLNQVGQGLFHDNQHKVAELDDLLARLATSANPGKFEAISNLLDYIESAPELFDADRLAFRETLQSLQTEIAKDASLPAIKLHKRIGEDLDALTEIEHNYDKEISGIFNRFEQRGIVQKRERWNDYVAHLKKLFDKEQILKDYGVIVPYKIKETVSHNEEEGEVYGRTLPPKTVVLTFDDGPHQTYTAEIEDVLKQYGVPAIFFEVGNNLGTLDTKGKAELSKRADISRKLLDDGFVIGNHSMTHAQLSKKSGDALKEEILGTDAILQAVDKRRSPLFRFPYGARNEEGLEMVQSAHLRSVMWNIDSLDWADPIPSSIVDRVLHSVEKEGHGIILFHDIHDRALKALPQILDRLIADGYQFAGWDGNQFSVKKEATITKTSGTISAGYSDSWAVVIGIDDYAKWPKLRYAVADSQAIRQTLVERFGFASERVISLSNQEATRNGILGTFHDKLAHGNVQKNDRIFVFFAGHGATRQLSSGRELGYIIPVDSDPNSMETDAIPMTELQNIAESLTAKHIFFVMDACYSGLGLTRGGSSNYLRDNAKRIGRQMLTAGGADQMVADGGPNGHSVFTWALLQGLAGKADLNGDGLITATELAAYVAPAVANTSQQTPAFGSLPGSEGGDFIFELPNENEFISAQTSQLPSDAIALNAKLDAARPVAPPTPSPDASTPPKPVVNPVVVKDLQGADQKLTPVTAVPNSARQLAQRANDRGLQLFKEKKYAEAEAQFTEALKFRNDFALAANNLGYALYKEEKYPEAARWFENTLKLDPSRAIAYLNLGDAYVHSGDKDKAKKAFNTYLELQPNGSAVAYVKQQLAALE